MISYIADEAACGGVVLEGEDSAVAEPNSSVPGVHIEWDFQKGGWSASFVSGPLKGKSYFTSPHKLSQNAWDALRADDKVHCAFADAGPDDLSDAASLHLEAHCRRILDAEAFVPS